MQIHLRPVTPSDIPRLFTIYTEPEARWLAAFGTGDDVDEAAFDARWRRIIADPETTLTAIEVDGELVGSISAWPDEGVTYIGYWIAREHWGRGITTEAMRLALPSLPRPLRAMVAADNYASIHVLEKLGFRHTTSQVSFASGRRADIDERVYDLS